AHGRLRGRRRREQAPGTAAHRPVGPRSPVRALGARHTLHAPRRRRRRPRPPHALAEHPGDGEEPPPLHLDPAQPERPGDRLRRHDAPARLRERGRPRQLPQQRQ
ncbi:hypothetical protein STREPTOSP366_31490, partial [Streptomyces variabilis]